MESSCHLASLWLQGFIHHPPIELREYTCGVIASLMGHTCASSKNHQADEPLPP
jgi:hypothetical protein